VENCVGLAVVDITTGEFMVTEFSEQEKLVDEICPVCAQGDAGKP